MSQVKHSGVVRELRNDYSTGSKVEQAEPKREQDTGARIKARVAELVPRLGEWQQRSSAVMAASRLTTVAQAIVVPFPDAAPEQHLLLAKLGLVDFAMDDVADGEMGSLTDDEIHQAYTRYAETARSVEAHSWTGSDAAHVLGRAIQEVARELHASPGAGFLPLWQEHFRRFCVGHQRELEDKRQYQAYQRLPSLKHYLTKGWWSSGAPMYFSAVLAVQNPRYTGNVLEDPLIKRAFLHLGLAIRWFNDARSLDRELHEGKFNNSLILLVEAWKQQPGFKADRDAWMAHLKARLARRKARLANDELETMAEAMAVAQGDRNLELLQRTVSRLPPELQAWGKGMVTLVQLSRRVYLQHGQHGEFHHMKPDTAKVNG